MLLNLLCSVLQLYKNSGSINSLCLLRIDLGLLCTSMLGGASSCKSVYVLCRSILTSKEKNCFWQADSVIQYEWNKRTTLHFPIKWAWRIFGYTHVAFGESVPFSMRIFFPWGKTRRAILLVSFLSGIKHGYESESKHSQEKASSDTETRSGS